MKYGGGGVIYPCFDRVTSLRFTKLFPIFYICAVTACLGWVPSHIGIQGNERADVLAKAALDKTKIVLLYTIY